MKSRYFIPTLLISIISFGIMIGIFMVALGCMGGPSCSRWIGQVWLIFGLFSISSFGAYIYFNWGHLRESKGKITILSIMNILICIPLFLAIMSVIQLLLSE